MSVPPSPEVSMDNRHLLAVLLAAAIATLVRDRTLEARVQAAESLLASTTASLEALSRAVSDISISNNGTTLTLSATNIVLDATASVTVKTAGDTKLIIPSGPAIWSFLPIGFHPVFSPFTDVSLPPEPPSRIDVWPRPPVCPVSSP